MLRDTNAGVEHGQKVAIALFDASGKVTKQDSLTYSAELNHKQVITDSTNIAPLASRSESASGAREIFLGGAGRVESFLRSLHLHQPAAHTPECPDPRQKMDSPCLSWHSY